MLTLFTTPVIYLYLDRFSHWFAQRKTNKTPGNIRARRNGVAFVGATGCRPSE